MKTILYISCFCIFVSVEGFHMEKECIFTSKWTGNMSNSPLHVTSWIPEAEESLLLSITLNSKPSHLIHFWRSNLSDVIVQLSENDAKVRQNITVVKYSEEVKEGWADFNISVTNDSLEVWRLPDTRLLLLTGSFRYQSVTILGKYIIVNCYVTMTGWSISHNAYALIPFSIERNHHLSLFSKTGSRPSLSFPPSLSTLSLAWNGTSLHGISNLMQDGHNDPLPPLMYHNITVICLMRENSTQCEVKADKGLNKLGTFYLQFVPKTLQVTVPAGGELFVLIPHPSDLTDYMAVAARGSKAVREKNVKSEENAGFVVVVLILCMVFLGIIHVVLFSSITRSRDIKKKKRRQSLIEGLPDEAAPLMNHRDSPIPLPRGSVIMEEQSLWEVVQESNLDSVQALLEEGHHPDDVEPNRFTTPWMDAHILGLKDVIQVFSSFKGESFTTATNDLIKTILYELERDIKEIFLASECGMYEHERGVEALLKLYSLPGTIADSQGRSIVHYMASVTVMDGVPVWQSKDIRKFFANHEYYINAVDHMGRTALHELSQHPQEGEVDVIWDGKEWDISDAWLAMARILVSYGCDPRILDNKGRHAHDSALEAGNTQLAKYLEEKCAELGPINYEKSLDYFDGLVSAVRQGNTRQIRDLLLRHVPLMPLAAKSDLLVEAILNQHRNALFILLAAGAPLCNRSVGEVTPLEVAHNTLGLPACFPALIRKAYNEKLESEIARLPNDSEALSPLKQNMNAYNLQVMDVGSKAKWIFSMKERVEQCQEARRLLTQASELGLTLTCQLLGLEDLYIHSLPAEANSFQIAVVNKQLDTQIVLYRDLEMSPFTVIFNEDSLYWQLLEDFWIYEIKALETICQSETKGGEKFKLKAIVSKLRKLRNDNIWDPTETEDTMELLLYTLARYGFVTILHVVLSQCSNLDLNKVVHVSYRYTMLHVASAFGKMNILEYLMNKGVKLDSVCLGNYTPAHIAAIYGHRKCYEYIIDFMRYAKVDISKPCHIGLTASEILSKYEDLCDTNSIPILVHEDALIIKNEKDEQVQSYEMLQRRGTILKITTPGDLLRTAKIRACKKSETTEIKTIIHAVMEHFEKLITDSGYTGKCIPVGAFNEGREIFNVNNVDFLYEVSNANSHKELIIQDDEKEEKLTLVIDSEKDKTLYVGDAFIRAFAQRIRTVLQQLETQTPKTSLSPPFVECSSDCAILFLVVHYKEQLRFLQIRVRPVLPVSCSSDAIADNVPSELSKCMETNSELQLHLINELGEWTYCATVVENLVFQSLTKNQNTVLIACHLILRLLQSTWWAPRFSMRNRSKHWHTLSVGIQPLTERGLRTLFLQELIESQEWEREHLFKRIVSVFSKSCKRDMREKWAAKEYLNSFLTPKYFCCKIKESVCGIMKYLEELEQAEPQVPGKIVTFEQS